TAGVREHKSHPAAERTSPVARRWRINMNERRMMTDNPENPRDPRADALMDLLRSRRTIFDFLPDIVPSELLEEVVDAGRYAPNHKLTEPWRFTLVGPETRERIGTAWAASAVGRLPADSPAERVEEVRR